MSDTALKGVVNTIDDLTQSGDLLQLLFMAANDFDDVCRGPTQALIKEVQEIMNRAQETLGVVQTILLVEEPRHAPYVEPPIDVPPRTAFKSHPA